MSNCDKKCDKNIKANVVICVKCRIHSLELILSNTNTLSLDRKLVKSCKARLFHLRKRLNALVPAIPTDEDVAMRLIDSEKKSMEVQQAIDSADLAKINKPVCKLVGVNGNVFVIISAVSSCLRRAGLIDKASEFQAKALASESYDAVLRLCWEYVDIE